ncbi:MAG: ubiquinol-cytochrome C chaperone family protein [Magnetococcales bacterium]|nr:ubiquinol-cytochrome C chaperone family protein [Magnetococcales bacterium]
MMWFEGRQTKKRSQQAMRARAMTIHDHLAERTLALTHGDRLAIADDFPLRFDVMVFLAAAAVHRLRRHDNEEAMSQAVWEMAFEGFEESLRNRGVTDLRMGARMNRLLRQAGGRGMAYLTAWESGDETALRAAIARNILNGADPDDARVAVLLASAREVIGNPLP